MAKTAERHFFDLVLAGVAAAVMAGCAHEPPPPPPTPVAALPLPPPPPPPPPRHRAIPRPAHKPEAPPAAATPADDTIALAAPPAAARPPEAAPVPARPSELIGIDQRAAARLFGAAAETSEEPPATVWRWRNATCELDLFFYLDLRSGRMRSLRYTFKGEAAGDAEQQDCLRSLTVARRT